MIASASATEHSEVNVAGFQTTVLPAASAGAISSAGIVYGQFHGRDDADDALRDAVDEDALRRVDRGREQALDARRVGGGHPEVQDELLDLAVGLGVERLALVLGQARAPARPCDASIACGDPLQRRRALERRRCGPRPARPRAAASIARRASSRVALRERADSRSRGRVGRLEGLAGGRGQPARRR